MRKKYLTILMAVAAVLTAGYLYLSPPADGNILSYEADPQKQDVQLYWKDDKGEVFKSLGNLKAWLATKGRRLVFAMNGGMFKTGNAPQGLFIQDYKTVAPLDTTSASGNFYLKPNGVFYVTADRQAAICRTEQFPNNGDIRYATQSGPMLLIDGEIHPAFRQGSANVTIRNGVGVLPDGKVVFAMSKEKINFYDFAAYFRQLGCRNALYLDGYVSRTYLPEKKWMQTDGNFGVIIGISEKQ
jgi:uncharacterized protein YigE (DUF2233 family)